MNASAITFGIEIECYVPAGAIDVGAYHHGLPIAGFPEGWNAQHDGSLHTRRRGYRAVEVVSPVLKGIEGLRQVVEVVAKLKAMNATVNDCCGFHVHVGVSNDVALLNKVTHLVANFEQAIFAATGTRRRELGGYCAPIREAFRGQAAAAPAARHQRYHSLNLTNVLNGRKPTVEFRSFAGTLNVQKIIANIRLCVAMVERAAKAKKVTPWDAKPVAATSPIKRKGEGATALTRLFYQLGWIKGRQPHTHGDLTGEGLPTIQQSKRTLMRLARKYDGLGR